jgi:hypothetical protein
METIAIPHAVNKPTDNHLRRGVLRLYARHDSRSFRFADVVYHLLFATASNLGTKSRCVMIRRVQVTSF